ncbi:unnamed protein product [Prunus brigantina]
MRGSEPVVRGGLVVDVADSYPFEFPQGSSEAKVEVCLWIASIDHPAFADTDFVMQLVITKEPGKRKDAKDAVER